VFPSYGSRLGFLIAVAVSACALAAMPAFAQNETPGYTGDGGVPGGLGGEGCSRVGDGPIECSPTAGGDESQAADPAQTQSGSSGDTEVAGSPTGSEDSTAVQGAADGSVSDDQISDGSVESVTLARTGVPVLPVMMLGLTSLLLGLVALTVNCRRRAHVLARGRGSA